MTSGSTGGRQEAAMRIVRWYQTPRTLASNSNVAAGGLKSSAGPWERLTGGLWARASGELEAMTHTTQTVSVGIEFANFENAPLAQVYLAPAWSTAGVQPPDTTTPWANISVEAGKYLLARPIYLHISTTAALASLVVTSLIEIRFG